MRGMNFEDRVRELVDYIDETLDLVDGMDFDDFQRNRVVRHAVASLLSGAVSGLIGPPGDGHPGIAPLDIRTKIRAVRNRHGHDYIRLTDRQLWEAVQLLPRLRSIAIERREERLSKRERDEGNTR